MSFFVNEATSEKYLRVDAGCQWSQLYDVRLATFSSTSTPPSLNTPPWREEGQEIEFNHH